MGDDRDPSSLKNNEYGLQREIQIAEARFNRSCFLHGDFRPSGLDAKVAVEVLCKRCLRGLSASFVECHCEEQKLH